LQALLFYLEQTEKKSVKIVYVAGSTLANDQTHFIIYKVSI